MNALSSTPVAGRTLAGVDVAILAGGLGTRISSLLPDLPKVLAPVGGRPLLDILLENLRRQGARRVILCLGWRAQAVLDHLAARDTGVPGEDGLTIEPVVEPTPLGTAGAIAFALPRVSSDPLLVMNGDTLVRDDLAPFLAAHLGQDALASVLCATVADPRRYGRIDADPTGRILCFCEKPVGIGPALVNTGVYLFNRPILDRIAEPARCA